jgi:hypothetical protein
MDELASQSLELVNRELSQTLETARGEIEDFVDGQSNSEALVRAASMPRGLSYPDDSGSQPNQVASGAYNLVLRAVLSAGK